jgi:hypothetical protein
VSILVVFLPSIIRATWGSFPAGFARMGVKRREISIHADLPPFLRVAVATNATKCNKMQQNATKCNKMVSPPLLTILST